VIPYVSIGWVEHERQRDRKWYKIMVGKFDKKPLANMASIGLNWHTKSYRYG